MAAKLTNRDVGETVTRLRLFVPAVAALIFLCYVLERALFAHHQISRGAFLLLLFANPFLAAALAVLVIGAIERSAHAFTGILATGGDPHAPEYSEIEALVTQRRFVEAADHYRAVIEDAPQLVQPRIRLGELLAHHLGDGDGAAAALLAARALQPDPGQRTVIANDLIDLYRRTGDTDRLRAELVRFAREHPGTAAGRHALAEFKRLAAEQHRQPNSS